MKNTAYIAYVTWLDPKAIRSLANTSWCKPALLNAVILSYSEDNIKSFKVSKRLGQVDFWTFVSALQTASVPIKFGNFRLGSKYHDETVDDSAVSGKVLKGPWMTGDGSVALKSIDTANAIAVATYEVDKQVKSLLALTLGAKTVLVPGTTAMKYTNVTVKNQSASKQQFEILNHSQIVVYGADAVPETPEKKTAQPITEDTQAEDKPAEETTKKTRTPEERKTELINSLIYSSNPIAYQVTSDYSLEHIRVILFCQSLGRPYDYLLNPKLSMAQVNELMVGAAQGIDVTPWARPEINVRDMAEYNRQAVAKLLPVDKIEVPSF